VNLANERPPCTCHFVSWLINTPAKRMRKSTSRERARGARGKGKTQLDSGGGRSIVFSGRSCGIGMSWISFRGPSLRHPPPPSPSPRATGRINGAAVSIRCVFSRVVHGTSDTARIVAAHPFTARARALNRRNMHR